MMKLASIFLIACSLLTYANAAPPVKKVAVILNKTGENQDNSEWMGRGIRVGMKRLNSIGQDLSLEYFDDKGTEKGALEVAKKINKRKDIALVIAGYSSKTAIPLAQKIPHLPMIDVFGSSMETVANKDNHLSLVSDNDGQGRLMATFLKNELKKTRPCLIIESDDGFSPEVQRGFESKQEKKLEAVFSYNSRNKHELDNALKSCQKYKADILVHSGRTTSVRYLLEQHLLGNPEIPVLGSDGWGDFEKTISEKSAKIMKEKNARINFTYFWNDQATTPAQESFVKTYDELFKDKSSDTISALAHDAVILAAGFLATDKASLAGYTQNAKPLMPLALLGETKIQVPLKHRLYRLNYDKKSVLETK